jgi:hypothetical protein
MVIPANTAAHLGLWAGSQPERSGSLAARCAPVAVAPALPRQSEPETSLASANAGNDRARAVFSIVQMQYFRGTVGVSCIMRAARWLSRSALWPARKRARPIAATLAKDRPAKPVSGRISFGARGAASKELYNRPSFVLYCSREGCAVAPLRHTARRACIEHLGKSGPWSAIAAPRLWACCVPRQASFWRSFAVVPAPEPQRERACSGDSVITEAPSARRNRGEHASSRWASPGRGRRMPRGGFGRVVCRATPPSGGASNQLS